MTPAVYAHRASTRKSQFHLRYAAQCCGVADECVTQSLRQGDAKAFKKYSQMKLQMKREALVKLNRMANEQNVSEDLRYGTARVN